jgi:hypothetical protein
MSALIAAVGLFALTATLAAIRWLPYGVIGWVNHPDRLGSVSVFFYAIVSVSIAASSGRYL